MPLIKRYPNRKLYDTAARRYVSLEDIASLVRTGTDVQVVDSNSREDLTAQVLMQVILEMEKRRRGFLPKAVLTGLVRAGGDTLAALREAMSLPLDFLHLVDEEIEERLRSLVERGELSEDEAGRLLGRLLALGRRSHPGVLVGGYDLKWALSEQLDRLETEIERIAQQRASRE